MLVDLRDEIESHCDACKRQHSEFCGLCFFSSVNFGRIDLGGKRVYARAFRYLKRFAVEGFFRNDRFGSHLHINRKAAIA